MTGKAGCTLINIPAHAIVLVVGFRIRMAGRAGKFRIVCRVRMAIHALAPLPVMFPTVNGEILAIMVKSRGRPGRLRVTGGTIR